MSHLDKPCQIILKKCMALKSSESCLIITDSKLSDIGHALYTNSRKITKSAKLILMPILESHGQEPPSHIARQMLNYDVILMPTTKSLSHTTARKNASEKGARIASMPGMTIDMMKRALDVDFNKIQFINEKLITKLKNKSKMMIKTRKGTDIEFDLKGREWKTDCGIYTKKGSFGNLPTGEVFIAPLEGKANGTLVVDASVGGFGKVDKNIEIRIKNGFIANAEGGKTAHLFEESLKKKLYKGVAELGIGTNYKAKVTGEVLEDEKIMGTFHVAFGSNKHFGGKVDVPYHVDVVMKSPTIYADGIVIMRDGKMGEL